MNVLFKELNDTMFLLVLCPSLCATLTDSKHRQVEDKRIYFSWKQGRGAMMSQYISTNWLFTKGKERKESVSDYIQFEQPA